MATLDETGDPGRDLVEPSESPAPGEVATTWRTRRLGPVKVVYLSIAVAVVALVAVVIGVVVLVNGGGKRSGSDTYASTDEIWSRLTRTLSCGSYTTLQPTPNAAQLAQCDVSLADGSMTPMVMMTFDSDAKKEAQAGIFRGVGAIGGMYGVVEGGNWLVNCHTGPVCEAAAKSLGGRVDTNAGTARFMTADQIYSRLIVDGFRCWDYQSKELTGLDGAECETDTSATFPQSVEMFAANGNQPMLDRWLSLKKNMARYAGASATTAYYVEGPTWYVSCEKIGGADRAKATCDEVHNILGGMMDET